MIDESDDESFGFGKLRRLFGGGSLLLACLGALVWNERESVAHLEALGAAAGQVQLASHDAVDPALEGKLVQLSADVKASGGVADPLTAVKVDGVALARSIQMYQWVEYEEDAGRGKTRYSYELSWAPGVIDSSKFYNPTGHSNPQPSLSEDVFFADSARFGPYRFSSKTIVQRALGRFDDEQALSYGDITSIQAIGDWIQPVTNLPELSNELMSRGFQHWDSAYYKGKSQHYGEPELGDLMISYFVLPVGQTLSIVAMQQGDTLVPWPAPNGESVEIATAGFRSAQEIFLAERNATSEAKNTIRLFGVLGSGVGLGMVFGAIGAFLTFIPVIGRLIAFSAFVAGALIGLVLGLIAMAVGWVAANPMLGGLMMAAIVAPLAWVLYTAQRQRKTQAMRAQAAELSTNAKLRLAEKQGLVRPGKLPPPPGARSLSLPEGVAAFAPSPVAAPNDGEDLPPIEFTPSGFSGPPAVRPKTPSKVPPPFAAAPDPSDDDGMGPIEFTPSGRSAPPSVMPYSAAAKVASVGAAEASPARASTPKAAAFAIAAPLAEGELPPLEFVPSVRPNPIAQATTAALANLDTSAFAPDTLAAELAAFTDKPKPLNRDNLSDELATWELPGAVTVAPRSMPGKPVARPLPPVEPTEQTFFLETVAQRGDDPSPALLDDLREINAMANARVGEFEAHRPNPPRQPSMLDLEPDLFAQFSSNPPPTPAAAAEPAAASTERVAVMAKRGYVINKLVQQGQTIGFELLQHGEEIARGTQVDIKAALQKRLASRG